MVDHVYWVEIYFFNFLKYSFFMDGGACSVRRNKTLPHLNVLSTTLPSHKLALTAGSVLLNLSVDSVEVRREKDRVKMRMCWFCMLFTLAQPIFGLAASCPTNRHQPTQVTADQPYTETNEPWEYSNSTFNMKNAFTNFNCSALQYPHGAQTAPCF